MEAAAVAKPAEATAPGMDIDKAAPYLQANRSHSLCIGARCFGRRSRQQARTPASARGLRDRSLRRRGRPAPSIPNHWRCPKVARPPLLLPPSLHQSLDGLPGPPGWDWAGPGAPAAPSWRGQAAWSHARHEARCLSSASAPPGVATSCSVPAPRRAGRVSWLRRGRGPPGLAERGGRLWRGS